MKTPDRIVKGPQLTNRDWATIVADTRNRRGVPGAPRKTRKK